HDVRVTNPATGVGLHGPALAAGLLLSGYLVVGQPMIGWWSQRRFARALRRGPGAPLRRDPRAPGRGGGPAGVGPPRVAGVPPAQRGVRMPRLDPGAAPFTVAGLAGLLATAVVFAVVRRRLHRAPAPAPVAPEAVLALLPRTFRERRSFAGLALTAGICEET